MIFTERTIRVSNGTSSISSPIILYKGDKNIKIRFKIVDCPYTYSKNVDNIIETSEASYAQLIIKTPNNGTPILSDIAEPENGYVTFIITGEMIDEAKEVGKYSLQIRLLDDEQYGRITIPEVVDGIEVREPMVTEGVSTTNEVDVAVVDYAVTTAAATEDAFDSEGNYIETNWQSGNVITSAKLNKIEDGITGVNSQIKEIPNRTIVEDGKLYLVKSDGTKIDSGTTLPTVGNSDDNNTDSGTYDTEISLPFTATSDTDVELTFSPGTATTYDLEVGDLTITNAWSVSCPSSPYTFEAAEYKGKKCVHFSKDSSTTAYGTIASINPNSRLLDKTHKYYSRMDICLISDGANDTYPKLNGAKGFSVPINTSSLDTWQTFSEIQTPTNSTNACNLRAFIDGEAYFVGILVDLTLNGLETKTLSELNTMYENGEFTGGSNSEFSAIINNGGNRTAISPFTNQSVVEYATVSTGNTLSIEKNGGYNLANVAAKIKATSSTEIEDYQYIINTRFKGKTVVFEGDSITDSDYHTAYNGKSWADYLAIKLALGDTVNQALGGSSISTYNASGSVVNRITSTNYPPDTKLFCIMAGTNDWNSNVALGDIDSTDTSTILGALNTIIDHLQTNYPDATIVIMTPMHRSGMRTATRTAGTLSDVATAYEEVCMNWGVNCINTLKEFGINAYNTTVANKFYVEQNSDWLHPNPAGHKRIAIRMAGYISTL